MAPENFAAVFREFQQFQREGRVAELSAGKDGTIHVRAVGSSAWIDDARKRYPGVLIAEKPSSQQHYYFLSDELRPGSGIIRVSGGRPEGPEGTLTCLLATKDGRHNYFAAAGHVLSGYWNPKDKPGKHSEIKKLVASIYRHRQGFPATKSTHFLGKLRFLSATPRPINRTSGNGRANVDLDIGIVELPADFADVMLKQRTTCYGNFGEWSGEPDEKVHRGQQVMKCGAEETHWTYATVEDPCQPVTVYGPDGLLYQISNQVILTTNPIPDVPSADTTRPPRNWPARPRRAFKAPFAVPGDSGTMVVDQESKRPVGMLIAGSILDGLYVMTPIQRLWKFWDGIGLVLLRA